MIRILTKTALGFTIANLISLQAHAAMIDLNDWVNLEDNGISIATAGLSLPPITLILPYKYRDEVLVSFNARNALHQLKLGGDAQGSFKFVSAQLTANISNLFTKLDMMGQLVRKCENPDPSICDQYMAMAKEMALKSFYAILPSKDNPEKGDTNPLVVADKDKTLSVVSAHLAFDEQSFEKDFNFKFSFSNDVFSSVRTQARLDVRNVGTDVLDPEVFKLLQDKRAGKARM